MNYMYTPILHTKPNFSLGILGYCETNATLRPIQEKVFKKCNSKKSRGLSFYYTQQRIINQK